MVMKHLYTRNAAIGAAIILLVILNLWKWWPSATLGRYDNAADINRALSPADFTLPGMDDMEKHRTVKRDLFSSRIAKTEKHKTAVSRRKSTRPTLPTSISKQQARDAEVRKTFASIHLAGVVFRAKRGEAFLTKNGEPVTVRVGDTLFDRFQVLAVTEYSVRLKEQKSGLEHTIELSGEQQ